MSFRQNPSQAGITLPPRVLLVAFAWTLACFGASPRAWAQLVLEDDRVVIANEVNVNSVDLDFSPRYYRDGIVFVTTHVDDLRYRVEDERIETNIMKLYQATRSFSGVLDEPQAFYRELNSDLHEGPVTFDSAYQTIYFTRNDELAPKRRRRKTLRRLRVYSANWTGDEWTGERQVDFNAADANTAHPALSPDGKLLVFASDRDGGYGGMDLWAVAKEGDDWGEPYNLGPFVNTDGNDVFPFLHRDGTLYFASTTEGPDDEEGHLDLYYSRHDGKAWGKGVSLGPPFNSDDDDFGIIVGPDNKRGYFSSDRPGGLGEDDIYSFLVITEREGGPLDLTVDVSDAATGEPIAGAEVTYLNTRDVSLARALADGLIGATGGGLELTGGTSAETGADGRRAFRVGSGEYLLSVAREGYAPAQLPLALDGEDLVVPVALEPTGSCSGVAVVVLDEGTLRPVPGARVRFAGQLTGSDADLATDGEGTVRYCAPCEETFAITASLGGRRSGVAAYDTRGRDCPRAEATTLTLYLRSGTGGPVGNPLVEGTVLQLPSVYYRLDDWRLSANARSDLNHLAMLLRRYPGMRIELGSHTDARGAAAYNQALSQRRATEAKRYLVAEAGVGAARVTAVGYGESQIRNRCRSGVRCREREHRENRRTEVIVRVVEAPIDIPGELEAAAARAPYLADEADAATRGPRVGTAPAPASDRKSEAAPVGGGAGAGTYWVVAGTFGERVNAERRVRELATLGYADVELTSFDGGGSDAVVVARFSALAQAAQFSRALEEAHGIGAYVRRVRGARP